MILVAGQVGSAEFDCAGSRETGTGYGIAIAHVDNSPVKHNDPDQAISI